MDDVDRQILNVIQTSFPIVEEPFRAVAEQLGLSGDDMIERIEKLKEEGIIRRIGAVFDPEKIGFVSTLCAARVPEEKLKEFIGVVNSCPGVTHNYRRTHEYNIWFTLTGRNEDELRNTVKAIKRKTNVTDILSMRAVRTYKIKVNFTL